VDPNFCDHNPVTLQEMEDGIVATGVYSKYCNEIILLATWIHKNQASWFTEYGKGKYNELLVLQEGEKTKECHKHTKELLMEMLQNIKQTPFIHLESITPAIIMEVTSQE
jgi:hypothetical protein